MIAAALTLYGAGNIVFVFWLENQASIPIPSISDGLWLALYPLSYVGIVWLARKEWTRVKAGVWLDGVVAGLGVAAIGAARRLSAGPRRRDR